MWRFWKWLRKEPRESEAQAKTQQKYPEYLAFHIASATAKTQR